MVRDAWVLRPPGPVDYDRANAAIHELADLRLAGEIPDTLVLLEHPPVFTAGRTAKREHAVWPLAARAVANRATAVKSATRARFAKLTVAFPRTFVVGRRTERRSSGRVVQAEGRRRKRGQAPFPLGGGNGA